MKIRTELSRQLYLQKVNGYEKRPYYFENKILEAITDGDTEKLESFISQGSIRLAGEMRRLSDDLLRNIKYRFVLAADHLAQASLDSGLGHDEAYMIADIYSRKADRKTAYDDIQALLEDMCMDYAKRMQEIKKDNIISLHIRKCIDHIYEDLSGGLSAKELADFTDLNVTYLSKLFKQETGKTIKAYVTSAKIDTAQNLLRYSRLSCFEISASLGYSSQSAFTYAFRRLTGMTPMKYREKYYAAEERRL